MDRHFVLLITHFWKSMLQQFQQDWKNSCSTVGLWLKVSEYLPYVIITYAAENTIADSDDDPADQLCRKDVGSLRCLQHWSRGHQFVLRGGGHIDTWSPLYKSAIKYLCWSTFVLSICLFQSHRSESPSQVFVILIHWLLSLTQYSGRTHDLTLAYDNMCNLDKLKASCSPLPHQSPLEQLWMNVNKIIDVFHFSNHINPLCRQKYSSEAVKKVHPNWNTQAGEHT